MLAQLNKIRKSLVLLDPALFTVYYPTDLVETIDHDQQTYFDVSDLTREFQRGVIDQTEHDIFQQIYLEISQKLLSLKTTSEKQKNSLNTITSRLLNCDFDDHQVKVEQISQQIQSLGSQKGTFESELKLILNEIKLEKERFQILQSQADSFETQKQTFMRKTNEVTQNSDLLLEENISKKKIIVDEHQTQLLQKNQANEKQQIAEQDLNLIIVFEQTGRPEILKAREYIEPLLNNFVEQINPRQTYLVTFDDKVQTNMEIVNNKLNLPQLEKTGIIFKDYNEKNPNYSLITEGILELLKLQSNSNQTVSLLISQGLKDPQIIQNAPLIRQQDSRHKLFILAIDSQFNLSFWEKLSSDINQSQRNEKTGQDFFEVAINSNQVQRVLQKFGSAILLEKKKASLQSKEISLRQCPTDSGSGEKQISMNQEAIARSQINTYLQKSQEHRIQKFYSKIESIQASLKQKIQDSTTIQKQLIDREQQIQIIINQISTKLSECWAQDKIIRFENTHSNEEILLFKDIKLKLEEYLEAKNELQMYITEMIQTFSEVNTEPTEDLMQTIQIQMTNLQNFVD